MAARRELERAVARFEPEAAARIRKEKEKYLAWQKDHDAEVMRIEELSERVRPAPLVRVPFLPTDVHDLQGLAELGKYLFDADGEPAAVRAT